MPFLHRSKGTAMASLSSSCPPGVLGAWLLKRHMDLANLARAHSRTRTRTHTRQGLPHDQVCQPEAQNTQFMFQLHRFSGLVLQKPISALRKSWRSACYERLKSDRPLAPVIIVATKVLDGFPYPVMSISIGKGLSRAWADITCTSCGSAPSCGPEVADSPLANVVLVALEESPVL
eukprot:1286679-Amphidinium_carterae.2